MNKEQLLRKRNEMKAKKPNFVRQQGKKKKRLGLGWKKPRGIHSKLRHNLIDHLRRIQIGFKSPAEVRGMSREGLAPIIVNNMAELAKIREGQGAVISGSVGQKKRVEMLKKASDLGIKVINFKDISKYLKSVSEKIRKGKEEKQKEAKEKEKRQQEKEKKASEKKEAGLAEKLTEEEKKEKEKKEREKVLTKKEN